MITTSKVFFILLFGLVLFSAGITYYEKVVISDYAKFAVAEEVPEPADFIADIISIFHD